MDQRYYDAYLEARSRGLKEDATKAITSFVSSFGNDAERKSWTVAFLDTHTYGKAVRHEIYAGIIFPVLLSGAREGDVLSLYWLAGTAQNHYSDRRLGKQLNYRAEAELLKEAFSIEPKREDVRRALLAALVAGFDYFVGHDLPLLSAHGACPAHYDEVLEEASFARTLDANGAFAGYLNSFESEVRWHKIRCMAERGG